MKHSFRKEDEIKYGMVANAVYMISLAWRRWRSVLIYCVLLAVLAVATNLAELYIAPVILSMFLKSSLYFYIL